VDSIEVVGTPTLTITVPIYNEEANIRPLYEKVCDAMEELDKPWELVLVDDGSRDGSGALLMKLSIPNSAISS